MWRRSWPLGAVVLLQLGILAAIPLRQARARLAGTEVTLETMPVDPYDLLSGYYVTLRYRAEEAPRAAGLGEGEAWLVLAPGSPAWSGVEVRAGRPVPAPGQVAIRVEVERGRVRIPSAGRFYVPEARRHEVDEALRAVRSAALVDLKVGEDGSVALLRLRAGAVTIGR
ncbi:MAG TPA: GDYXXLXY domain-containing protein [Anaeromyxobacter sp.]|nr:GDYXXLXY domain-containing protein [Anaeromyxobacter sp.]